MPIEDIKNCVRVDDWLLTAGQPTEDQLRDVATAGYRTVINLGLLDPRYCLPDEAGLANSLGLDYRHIPVQFDAPRRQDFDAFVGAMDEHASQPTFVHCAANYRVSAFVALYRELRGEWSPGQADAHIRRVWEPNAAWQRFIEDVRGTFRSG